MDFRFVPSGPRALTSCYVGICGQGDDSASGPAGVWPVGGEYMMATRSDLDRVQRIRYRARDTQPTTGVGPL